MLLSVIIPTYNRLELLRRTLESVYAQTFTDFEIVVVDAGSSDGTGEYLRSLGTKLIVRHEEQIGPGAARNRGCSVARGEYAAFLDSDDTWFPWTLATYASVIRGQRSPAFIAGKPFRFEREETLSDVTAQPVAVERFPDYLSSGREWRWWGVSSFVIRMDALRESKGFAEESINGEDGDLALKLGEAAGFVQITSPFTFGYREHVGNLTRDLGKTLAGIWYKVRAESAGEYPGGEERCKERWQILTRHVRPVSLACLREGRVSEGWRLYAATFQWHTRIGRWKYLVGFPFAAAVGGLRGH